ncbi:D-alanyl-D-alanine endopeptidase [Azomonas macrocytogenes]|uniref:D-alanyl-D-alanine endopeptidase (Penicillin-binding protein 7) n=1 Tax=Azomonas macrocytogenes TaxID=69962 RepID=A0A839T7P9_AZOMA|nr:D-alanyl-D-alanine endopeptidase [Azomonas macrocytogenes]MBB3104486.1 D-alanyl-D-alanine endopeptidase (penicillin-binding protein 7) [Azomonas macrocytogenes]
MRARTFFSACSLFFLSTAILPVSSVYAAQPKVTVQAKQLELASTSALVVDLNSGKEVFASFPDTIVPIASITKLMTAMVVLDARQSLDEVIPVTIRDTQDLKGVFSRVRVGSLLSRREMLRLALMSSENRAASTLAHNYPGGHTMFVAAMNAKARALGLRNTRFAEPTGLSTRNVSTARDLVTMLKAARQYTLIRQMSTTPKGDAYFRTPNYALSFFNTNPLVRNADWHIQLSKTGFTDAAGHCLVMVAEVGNRPMAMVLMGSLGKASRFADASRVRSWVETGKSAPLPIAAISYKQQRIQQLRQLALSRAN